MQWAKDKLKQCCNVEKIDEGLMGHTVNDNMNVRIPLRAKWQEAFMASHYLFNLDKVIEIGCHGK